MRSAELGPTKAALSPKSICKIILMEMFFFLNYHPFYPSSPIFHLLPLTSLPQFYVPKRKISKNNKHRWDVTQHLSPLIENKANNCCLLSLKWAITQWSAMFSGEICRHHLHSSWQREYLLENAWRIIIKSNNNKLFEDYYFETLKMPESFGDGRTDFGTVCRVL